MPGPILTALSRQRPGRMPIWFMRQAGRSLPEYQAIRAGISMLDSCLIADLAAEITLQPVRRYDVDAAIFYSDIMIPLKLAGVEVDIIPGVGPVFASPIRSAADVAALPAPTISEASSIVEAIKIIRAELPEQKTLIGFAGAPFTLAAYMIEGKPEKTHLTARSLLYKDPDTWKALLSWCAKLSNEYLKLQVEAGVEAIQLFDSWAGCLSRSDYINHVMPFSQMSLAQIPVPAIHFATGSTHLLDVMAKLDVAALGVDHCITLNETSMLAPELCLQGNIDPAYLFTSAEKLFTQALMVAQSGSAAPAHIMNLGHGVPPNADPGLLTELVAFVHTIKTSDLTSPPHPS